MDEGLIKLSSPSIKSCFLVVLGALAWIIPTQRHMKKIIDYKKLYDSFGCQYGVEPIYEDVDEQKEVKPARVKKIKDK